MPISKTISYVTRRDKVPVSILLTNLKGSDHPVVGILKHKENEVMMQWTAQGHWMDDDGIYEHPLDLIPLSSIPSNNPNGGGTPVAMRSLKLIA